MKKTSRSQSQIKSANQRNMPTIGEYLERLYEYRSYPGKIKNGVMFVLFHGHWISKGDFDKVAKAPSLPSLLMDNNNIDKTKSWMLTN